MSDPTVTSTGNYTILVGTSVSPGTERVFKLCCDIDIDVVAYVPGTDSNNLGMFHWVDRPAKLKKSGGIDFWMSCSTGDTIDFKVTTAATSVATLNASGELDLSGGSLRLFRVNTLPASPTEGQVILFDNTSPSWTRLAAYINGGWRYSGNL